MRENGRDRGTVNFCGHAGVFSDFVRAPEVAGIHGRARPIVCSASITSCYLAGSVVCLAVLYTDSVSV